MRGLPFYLCQVKRQSIKSWMKNLVKKYVLDVKLKSCERNAHLLSKNKGGGVQSVGKDSMVGYTNKVKEKDSL